MSNGNVRKLIREFIASAVNDGFDLGPVFARRSVDATDLNSYGNVFFSDGVAEYDGLLQIHTAELSIGIHLKDPDYDDNDLDDCSDIVQEILKDDEILTLGGLSQGMIYSGFEYAEPDDSGFISIYLNYTIQY